MSLYDLAGRVAILGDLVTEAATRIERVDPGARVFGADAAGRLGELGRALHRQHAAALVARAVETSTHGDRLLELARDLREAADHYDAADHAQIHRHQPGVG